jgi:ATP-dependent Clp protease adaptor protein ClpS
MRDHGDVTDRQGGGGRGGTLTPERADELDTSSLEQRPWVTIVWDDPVNLMTYVTHVFQTVFGYSREKATTLMLQVHHQGRAAVSTGTREEMERDVARLHAAGLWATVQQD